LATIANKYKEYQFRCGCGIEYEGAEERKEEKRKKGTETRNKYLKLYSVHDHISRNHLKPAKMQVYSTGDDDDTEMLCYVVKML
jgi:hypothetical protein